MLHIREFAPEAQFCNPCVSFSLPSMVCTFCNLSRDLDLCRDPELLAHNWNCPSCQQPFDKKIVEKSLVDIVERKNERYQLQDLVCKNCRLPQSSFTHQRCTCSGEFSHTESPEELMKSLKVIHGIAIYHQFGWLQEVVEWHLDVDQEAA